MENERFNRGLEKLKAVDGHLAEGVLASLEDIAPDVGKYIIEFAFGDIYSRGVLSFQERELITITSLLTSGGCEPQLAIHIAGALNVGVSPEKIIEAFIQCISFTGFPRVLNALEVAKRVFAERGIVLEK